MKNNACIGIIMLDSQFPRIPGDVGNPKTWDFPVIYKIVKGAKPDIIVRKNPEIMIDKFIKAAKELVEKGAEGITTSCGFLSIFQKQIAKEVNVPVMTSALMQVPIIQKTMHKNKKVGILTINASTLSKKHLRLAGVSDDVPIGTTEGAKVFTNAILNDEKIFNVKEARKENVNAAMKLVKENENIGAIVLECTNMIPYANDISIATKVPVFSLETMIQWFQAGLAPKKFNES